MGCLLGLLMSVVTAVATFITGIVAKLVVGLAMILVSIPFKLLSLLFGRRKAPANKPRHKRDTPPSPGDGAGRGPPNP